MTGPLHIYQPRPIVIAAAIWGRYWQGQRICFICDNMDVADVLKHSTSKDQQLMHLLCCLLLYAAFYRFEFESQHIPGVSNTAADAISRDNLSLFSSLIPQLEWIAVPQAVLDLLVIQRPNWGSQAWTRSFASSLPTESPVQPNLCTKPLGAATQASVHSPVHGAYHPTSTHCAGLQPRCPNQCPGAQYNHTSVA